MRTFFEFTQGTNNPNPNGAENPTIPVGGNSQTPTPTNGPPQKSAGSPNEDEAIESLTNDVQRALDRLFTVLGKHNMNKQKAKGMLTSIIANIAKQYDLDLTKVLQAGKQGVQVNNEPVSPPLQPMAQG
jgi:heme-binding NEAT domain protein